MHIVYLSHRVPYPPDKGEKIRTYHQILFLMNLGHKVTVLAPIENEGEKKLAERLSKKLGVNVITRSLSFHGLRKAMALLKGEAMSFRHFYSPALRKDLDAINNSQKLDAIICTSAPMAKYLTQSPNLIAKHDSGSTKWLMDFMDLDSEKWQQYHRVANGIMRWIYAREAKLIRNEELKIYDGFDTAFFISQNEVDLFSQFLVDNVKLHAAGNGLDTTQFYPPTNPVKTVNPVFLFTGVMDYKPNEDAVLWFFDAIWPDVVRQWPNAKYIIAGMQPSGKIKALGNQPGVTVTGYVEDMLPFFHGATMFVAPFRLARGVQNKILQAFACGLPVVTTSKGAEGINCQHKKHLLVGDTEQEILKHIKYLVEHQDFARIMASEALNLIRQSYSWEGQLKVLDNALSFRKTETGEVKEAVEAR